MLFRMIWHEIMRRVCRRKGHPLADEWRVEIDDRGAFSHRQLYRVCTRCGWEKPYPPFTPGATR